MRTLAILTPMLACLLLMEVNRATGQSPATTQPKNNFFQPSVPIRPPTVSPYLGLLRNNGANMGLNYFNIVRPEMQMRNALTQQQAEQQRLANETRRLAEQQQAMQRKAFDPFTQSAADPITGASRTLPPTGHSTSLMNLGGRFMSR